MATLTPEQLEMLSPQHKAMIAAAQAAATPPPSACYRIADAVSLACTSGNFIFQKRTEIKDMIIAGCADGSLECTPRGRTDYDINRDSFCAWLRMHTPAPVVYTQEPAKVDYSWLVYLFLAFAFGYPLMVLIKALQF